MTDDEIIRLLEEKELEDLTADELELVREQMQSSPAVRKALHGRLSLEQSLATVAGGVRLSSNELFRDAKSRSSRIWRIWLLTLGLLILASGALVWWNRPAPAPVEIVSSPPPPTPLLPLDEIRRKETPGDEALRDSPLSKVVPEPPEVAPVLEPQAQPPDELGARTETSLEPKAEAQPISPPTPAGLENDDSAVAPVELAYGGELKAFEATALDEFDEESAFPTRRQLRSWFSPVKDAKGELTEREERGRMVCRLDGLFEVTPLSRGLWEEDLVLRVSLAEMQGFRLHLCDALGGLTLRYHSTIGVWAVYRSSRPDASGRTVFHELLLPTRAVVDAEATAPSSFANGPDGYFSAEARFCSSPFPPPAGPILFSSRGGWR